MLFFPGGSGMIAYLNTDKPIIYLTDSTFHSMINYYDSFSNLLPSAMRMGSFIESNALKKASHVIFASHWAKHKAIEFYGCQINKISVLPFGANIDKIPDRELILKLRKKNFSACTLLLVGVSWERKGCQLAFDAMCMLNERGIETELIICGCEPPEGVRHDRLTITGFLDKNNPEDSNKIEQLYMRANIFILPTRNECAGIVFCEASAYGLPTIATDTGGVSTYIKNDENGYLLSIEATAEEYADAIESIISDNDRYFAFAVSSRQIFERKLNWDSWGRSISELINDCL
jgi:glycosyltransferase involved in cell wall biosynthesis